MPDFNPLLDEQLPRLMRYSLALTRDADESVDLVEDTLREAIAQEREGRRSADLHVWLLTILHEQRDNPFRCRASAGAAHRPRAQAPDPMLSQFDRALGRLPEEQRAVILLIGLEGMSYDKTAAILRVPVGTMRSRLLNGRESLRQAMTATPARPAARTQRRRSVARAA